LHGYKARTREEVYSDHRRDAKAKVPSIEKASEQGKDGKSRVFGNIVFLWPDEMERAKSSFKDPTGLCFLLGIYRDCRSACRQLRFRLVRMNRRARPRPQVAQALVARLLATHERRDAGSPAGRIDGSNKESRHAA
jgi:hypothetical protein